MADISFYIHQSIQGVYSDFKRYAVAHGGRGSGKSIQFGAICLIYAMQNANDKVLCVRGTQNKISESSLQVLKDVIMMMGVSEYFIETEHTLKCKNGTDFLFYGAKNPTTFKSVQGIGLCWVDEATELSEKAWDLLIPTVRTEDSQFLVSFNPEYEDDACYEMFISNPLPNASICEINYWDNPFFPNVLKNDMEIEKERNYAKYLHVWEGKLIQAIEGALWKTDMIQYLSQAEYNILSNNSFEDLERIVVAVDPATTSKSTSDACGIVVVGKYKGKNKYVVLEELTKVCSPNEWCTISIMAYDKYKADRIVAEINQGGDMVETIIKNKRRDVAYKGVHATRGKIVRAEPIASLYENREVFHAKRFSGLEFEMVTYTGEKNEKSPNSLDALVWGLTDLAKNSGEMSVSSFSLSL